MIAGTDSPKAPAYLKGVHERYAGVPNIRYTGYVAEEDVPRIFGEAAVVVFPYTSTTGNWAPPRNGRLRQGCGPAPHRDFAEVIAEEGYVGEFFEPDDPQNLASAIARVIDDPEHRRAWAPRTRLPRAACRSPMSLTGTCFTSRRLSSSGRQGMHPANHKEPTAMQINTKQVNTISVVELAGRFDAHEVPEVRKTLTSAVESGNGRVVIDLGGVNFVDFSGLACLVQGMKHCRERGADAYLCNLQQPVRIIFELTRLDRAFRFPNDRFGGSRFRRLNHPCSHSSPPPTPANSIP